MRKLGPVVLAVVVGCACAFYLFKNVEDNTKVEENGNAVAIQIGVFKTVENAEKMKDTYGGLVFKDEDLYRVYYSILNQNENIEFMTNYLTNQGINYYLKEITVDDALIDESYEYESLMSSTNDNGKLAINEELLNIYKEVV